MFTISAPIKANIKGLKEVQTSLKSVPMLSFLGTFSVNFEILDYYVSVNQLREGSVINKLWD
jgi:hypothetical protein